MIHSKHLAGLEYVGNPVWPGDIQTLLDAQWLQQKNVVVSTVFWLGKCPYVRQNCSTIDKPNWNNEDC